MTADNKHSEWSERASGLSGRSSESSGKHSELNAAARGIFLHALEACGIESAMERNFCVDLNQDGKGVLRVAGAAEIPLAGVRRLRVMAMGKAALPMLDSVLRAVSRVEGMDVAGICDGPQFPAVRDARIRYFAGGHPVPNRDSFEAAEAMLEMARGLGQGSGQGDVALFLLSGGASAMLELPLDRAIGLEDTAEFYRALVHSGAAIAEINCVRKHFSAVKGGRLAAAAAGASRVLTLAVSDVPADQLHALGSGPTLPDDSSAGECMEIIRRYGLMERFPASVRRYFEEMAAAAEGLEKTGRVETSSGLAANLSANPFGNPSGEFVVLLSNEDLVERAKERAEALGFHVEIDNACDDWECSAAAAYLLERLRELRAEHGRVCLLSGGEITVHVAGTPGVGGRNQQFALACALRMDTADGGVAVLSAGSDGVDGNSEAAGAVVDAGFVDRAKAMGLDPERSLAAFDAGRLFEQTGDGMVTGATGNNLRDLRILLGD